MLASNRTLVLSSLAIAGAANAAAYAFDLFDAVFWIDKGLHLYTSFAVTLFLAFMLRQRSWHGSNASSTLLVISVASIGLALGVLWEVGEWLADWVSAENTIKGKTDTIMDLIFDAAGAVAAGVLAIRGISGE